MKHKKLRPLSKLKKDLWEIFRHWIYIRDDHICFTCGKRTVEGTNCQAGHFIKAAVCGIFLYFHEDNVHVQCAYCNGPLDGDQYHYGIKLGKKKVKELEKLRLETKDRVWGRKEFEEKIAYYKAKIAGKE